MQYALMKVKEHRFLIDATEWQILKDWQTKQIKEQTDFNESEHQYYLCYGGYLLNPKTPDKNINDELKLKENFWLAAIDEYHQHCYQIAFYSIQPFPLITVGQQRIVPFAALIKANDEVIIKISSRSNFAVSAFLRFDQYDIPTNILNRKGIFAFKGIERRHKEPVNEHNWSEFINKGRAHRCAKDLIGCNHF